MIIWSGWGFLVAIIVIINTLLGKVFFESITGDATYFQEHSWPMAVMFIISGLMSWYLGKYINKPSGKVYIDAETGEKVMFNKMHSLFFIKMEYWGPILGVVAVITLIAR
ncbi:hypothetical protein COJ48_18115 [Bacillus cereus]|uniref:Uncharacterized protein n=1 Tax=Bacillus paramycoides TaxID=2026194 RepID=A0ABU6N6D6_9BACI|nr:hypothetical protein [Bacillus paramycoides]PFD34320.1 hypothetical protein CN285_25770 [Bacillus cereus]MED0972783.1 hypothetical protein [Bacillus paramycoides]MED0981726.1 hypothetical protein [Bacillus paramycoides]MED0987876.1 hypothetical protein [Bacillus paramycoides]MED1093788.1 hypothetical protein [Bacillus paramycoides]